MTYKTTLDRWNPGSETLDASPRLSCVKGTEWNKGSLDRVVAAISSHIRSNSNLFSGVDKEKAAALGKVICQKALSDTDKKVLEKIYTHVFGDSLTPEKRAKLLNIQREFYKGTTGTSEISLKLDAEQWLKVQNKWLPYLSKIKGLQDKELALLHLLNDPAIFPYTCQLNVLFPGLRFGLISALEGVKPHQRDAMVVVCHILCAESSWDHRSKILKAFGQRDPTLQDILNKITALPRNKRANHLSKIRTFTPMCEKQLQGLLAIPVDRFDAALKRAKPWMLNKQDYEKTNIVIAVGSMATFSLDEQEEVLAQATQFTKMHDSYSFSKCIQLLTATPREHRKRLLIKYQKLSSQGYSFLFMKVFLLDLPTKDWLKIDDRWIEYLRSEFSSEDKVEILKLFMQVESLFSFAEKLSACSKKRRTVEVLYKCTSDVERQNLVDIVSLLNLHQNSYYYPDWLDCLENTGIPYQELLPQIGAYLSQVPHQEVLLNIFKGLIKDEPDYFNLAFALIKGLNRNGATCLSDQLRYRDSRRYRLALSLIHEEMVYEDRAGILKVLSECSEKEGQKLVDLVKTFQIKKKIGKALSLLKETANCTQLIPRLNSLDTSDEVKVALLEILPKNYTASDWTKAISHLLSLLSNTEELASIASAIKVDLIILQSYDKLLQNILPSLKMAILHLIVNKTNYREFGILLSSLTEGFNAEDVQVVQNLTRYTSEELFKLIQFVLQATNSKNSRIILLKIFRLFSTEYIPQIIDTIQELKTSDLIQHLEDLSCLCAIHLSTPACLKILKELHPLMKGTSTESRLLLLNQKGYYQKVIEDLPEKNLEHLFSNTTGNFKALTDALVFAHSTLSLECFNTLLTLNLEEKPDGKQKAIAIYQHTVFIKLKEKFPQAITLLSTLVFSTTKEIQQLLSLESTGFLKESLPFMEGLICGDEKLKVLKRMHDAQKILDTCFPKGISDIAKFNLRKLLITTHLDTQLIQKLLHNARKDFIVVLLAESLAHENRDYELLNKMIDTLFKQLDLYLPMIFERPFLMQYLIRHHYYKMHEVTAHKSYPPHIRSLLIPFLSPRQIVALVLDEEILQKPVLSGERSWPTPASAFEDLQRSSDLNLILSEFGEEGFVQAIPFATLALLAKRRPELLLPYLSYFGDLQLAATLPFLDPQKVAEERMPLSKVIVITKRAPVQLKKLLVEKVTPSRDLFQIQLIEAFYKACQQGDPYPIPLHKQEELEAAKKTLESKVDDSQQFDIPPRYQDCTSFEVMIDPIELPQKGKYVDRTSFDRFQKEEGEIKNPIDNLFYPATAYKPDLRLKEELRCIDKHTGQVLVNPLRVPPDHVLHIDASLLNFLEKNGDEVKSPFDHCFYPLESYLPDPDLETWLNELES